MILTIERLQEGYLVELGEPETMPGRDRTRKWKADRAAVVCEVLKWLEYGGANIAAVEEVLKYMPEGQSLTVSAERAAQTTDTLLIDRSARLDGEDE